MNMANMNKGHIRIHTIHIPEYSPDSCEVNRNWGYLRDGVVGMQSKPFTVLVSLFRMVPRAPGQ
jgi:hypothetical protein